MTAKEAFRDWVVEADANATLKGTTLTFPLMWLIFLAGFNRGQRS